MGTQKEMTDAELDFWMNKFFAEAEGHVPVDFPYKRTWNGVYSQYRSTHNRRVQANWEYLQPILEYRDAHRDYYQPHIDVLDRLFRNKRRRERRRQAALRKYQNPAWRAATKAAYKRWLDNKLYSAAMNSIQ